MIQTLSKNWLLLALCGVLYAIISSSYLVMRDTGFREWSTVVFMGNLALAAGACTVAAGIWRSAKGKCWLLVLNGLALSALGLILNGIFGFRTSRTISFNTLALLIILMAISIGILEMRTARTLRRRRHFADGWFLGLAGAASVSFAFAFLALDLHWIKVEPGSHSDILWLGSYFGFSAICMLGLALRLHSQALSPRHAH